MKILGVYFREETNPDHKHFYVSAFYDGKPYLVAGPYPDHQSAKDAVSRAQVVGEDQTPKAAFMEWGTCSTNARYRAGVTAEGLVEAYLKLNPSVSA